MTTATRFDWVRRMGVHEAYHLHPWNRVLHWLCIPIELAAVLKLLGAVPTPFDLGLAALAVIATIYVLADPVGGVVMALLMLALRMIVAPLTTGSAALDGGIALGVFVAAFVVQTRIGHGVFERGVDDTAMNLAELARTRNPIPVLLVFAYHALELLFAAGYRPALRAEIERHRGLELARIPNDPRPPVPH